MSDVIVVMVNEKGGKLCTWREDVVRVEFLLSSLIKKLCVQVLNLSSRYSNQS